MGQVLIIWDKLFGTYAEEKIKPVYGLTQNLNTFHPFKVIFNEFYKIKNDLKRPVPLSIKLKYLFNPPGWSHDGSSQTSEELRTKK
jgi:hypothetical protein